MDFANLVILLSAIVLSFVLQTWILKVRISDSLSSVDETLQVNLNQGHGSKLADALSKLDQLPEGGPSKEEFNKLSESNELISRKIDSLAQKLDSEIAELRKFVELPGTADEPIMVKIDALAQKMDAELARLQENLKNAELETKLADIQSKLDKYDECAEKEEKPGYLTFTYGQFLWFLFTIVFLCAFQSNLSLADSSARDKIFGFFLFATLAAFVMLVLYYLWQLYAY